MELSIGHIIVLIVSTVAIVLSSIVIVIAVKIQKRKKRKYQECMDIINKNKDITFKIKDSLTIEDINKIDDSIDVNSLMAELFDTFLKLEDHIKNLNNDFDDILTGFFKEFYIDKIKNFKANNYGIITDKIELIGYSITEFNKDILKFRVNINCFNYKIMDGKIVSGNNIDRLEQILIITYQKINDKWLISSCDKIYEKKLSN